MRGQIPPKIIDRSNLIDLIKSLIFAMLISLSPSGESEPAMYSNMGKRNNFCLVLSPSNHVV